MKFLKKHSTLFNLAIILALLSSIFYGPGLFMLLLGSYVSFLSIRQIKDVAQIEKKGIRVFGEIIAYKRDSDGYQKPIINFTTQNGKTIESEPYHFAASDANIFENFKNSIGKKVRIKYNSDEPEKFAIDGENTYGAALFTLFIGLIFVVLGISNLLGFIDMSSK